jgi:hypothetical protein
MNRPYLPEASSFTVIKLVALIALLALTAPVSGQVPSEMTTGDSRETRIAAFNHWLSKNGIVLKTLPKAKANELIYDCDSTLSLKQKKGDTLIYWLRNKAKVGMYAYTDTVIPNIMLRRESFGRTVYVDKIDKEGNLVFGILEASTFRIKNDSLFQLMTFLKIPFDSLEKSAKKAMAALDLALVDKLFKENTYEKFQLIFHPKLFVRSKHYEMKKDGYIITLDHAWERERQKYYQISITSQAKGKRENFATYLFDNHYRFLELDGCFDSELQQLKKVQGRLR